MMIDILVLNANVREKIMCVGMKMKVAKTFLPIMTYI